MQYSLVLFIVSLNNFVFCSRPARSWESYSGMFVKREQIYRKAGSHKEGCLSIQSSMFVVIDTKGLVKNQFGIVYFFFFGIDIETVELSSTQKLRPTYVGDIPTVTRPSLRDSVLFVG